jgi:hypothetical protein
MEFYSTINKNAILLFVGKWIELENIILREVNQAQNTYFLSYVEYRPNTNTSNIMKNMLP